MSELEVAGNAAVATQTRRGGKNYYFPEKFYSMVSDPRIGKFATAQNLPPSQRLQNLAMSRMNRWGHAPFYPGEMRVVIDCDPRTLVKAMEGMKDAGMFAPESTELCVVLTSAGFRRADRSNDTCMEPRHMNRKRRMWVDDWGWEPREGDWAELLSDTPSRKAIASGEVSGWGQMAAVSEIEISGKLEGTVRIRGGMVWQVSDAGNPICPTCSTLLRTCEDGAVLRCTYGHEWPNPIAA